MSPAEEAALLDVTREEVAVLFEGLCQEHLGMSGESFREMVDQGRELPAVPIVGHLLLMIGARPGEE